MSATATKSRPKNRKRGKKPEAIYQEVTDRIIAAMDEGHIPWQRPWRVRGGVHKNLSSKKDYRGINQFLLDLTAMEKGYTSPFWMTYRQAEGMGGNVKKGEKSTIVVFFKPLVIETDEVDNRGRKIKKTIPLLRHYPVFNVEQCENMPEGKIPVIEEDREVNVIENAQRIIDEMPKKPRIIHRGDSAFYSPLSDFVGMPKQDAFDTDEAYYHTVNHELIHSTGHKYRLGRVKDWTAFGDDPYAKEELVAEMGAAMLAGVAGISIPETEKNTTAYIQHWVKRFKEDKKLLIGAASKAQQACEFILDTAPKNDEEE